MKNKQKKESKLIVGVASIFLIAGIMIKPETKPLVFENPTIKIAHAQEIKEEAIELTLEEKIKKAFPDQPEVAVALAKTESGLDPEKQSTTDLMKDGRAFSVGVMQINLTWHTLDGVDCSKAFQGKDYEAVVTNEALYEQCVKLASSPDINIETASKIYERSGKNFGKWGGYTNGSYKKHLKS